MSGSRAVGRAQIALAGSGLWPEFQGGAQALSRSMSHNCCLRINFTGQALPHCFVDYTQKNTAIQKHFRLLISILTMYHLSCQEAKDGKGMFVTKRNPEFFRWFEQKTNAILKKHSANIVNLLESASNNGDFLPHGSRDSMKT